MVDPRVMSTTVQEFLGVRYYLCGFYFQHKGRRLHRAVWEHHHGPVPKGFHVHHVNDDRSDNRLANLAMWTQAEHLSHHYKQKPLPLPTDKTRAAAAEWHGSKAGHEWHRQHGHATAALQASRLVEKTCEMCGKLFEVQAHAAWRAKYCHLNCRAKAFRRR